MSNIKELSSLFLKDLETAKNEKNAIEIKNIFFKKNVAPLYKDLKTASIEEKKELGKKLNVLKNELDSLFNDFISNLESASDLLSSEDVFNNSINMNIFKKQHPHLLNEVVHKAYEFFDKLGFETINGDEVVTDEFNFENLNIPKNHPARNMQDSLFIDKNLLLRTHCTVSTAERIKNETKDDIRTMSFGNVYRKDDDDATHSHQFMQIDFVWIKKDITLSNLKWLVDSFLKYIFEKDLKTNYRLSFFPFTEPSFEVDIECFKCKSKGCSICKNTGWIEVLGAGMLHPNVLKHTKIKDARAIAAGIGVERLAMLKYEITDIRDLYSNNFKVLKQFIKE